MGAVSEERIERPAAIRREAEFEERAGAGGILDVEKALLGRAFGGGTDVKFDRECFEAGDGIDGENKPVVGPVEDERGSGGVAEGARSAEDLRGVTADFFGVLEGPVLDFGRGEGGEWE